MDADILLLPLAFAMVALVASGAMNLPEAASGTLAFIFGGAVVVYLIFR